MDPREELMMLRRLAELEAKAQARPAKTEPQNSPANVPGSLRIGPFDTGVSMPVPLTNLLAGAGKAVVDTGRGLGQLVGAVSGDDVRRSRELDRPLTDTGAGFVGNVAGNVAMALSPGVALKGASMLPAAARVAPALSAAGSTLMAPKALGTATAVGAGMGAIQPAENLGERAFNTVLGAGAGALVPAAQWAGRTVKSAVEPFSEAGRRSIVGRALVDTSGMDPQALVQALRTGGRQIVPGSAPTVGQAAGVPALAAMERAAFATVPTVTNEVAERMAAQNAARAAALSGVAGDAATVEAAKLARRGATDALYSQADNVMVKMDDQLASMLRRPSMADAMRQAEKLAEDKGIRISFTSAAPSWQSAGGVMGATKEPEKFISGQALHFLKMALDDASNATPASGLGKNQIGAIRDNKAAFLNWVESRVPEYGQARQTFASMSRPINQMETAQLLQSRAINPLTGAVQPQAYARALDDRIAQQATKQTNATLAGVMNPQQMQTLNAIKDDLARAVFAQNAGRGAGSDTVQKLAYSNMLNQTGVPMALRNMPGASQVGNLLAQASQVGYSNANRQLSEKLAEALLDPKKAAALVKRLDKLPGNRAAEIARVLATPAALSLPGVVNAQQ